MTARAAAPIPTTRLRASPNFALAFALDGRPYVAKDTEPYVQYWLTDRYRILLSMFSSRRGATTTEAVDGYFRLTRGARATADRHRLLKAVEDMRAAGVLIGARDDTSRYSARIVETYLTHRPFPRELAELLVRAAPISDSTRVLDLAGGPGDLTLALAHVSTQVSLMDLSRGFLAAARRRAKGQGLTLTTLHDSCNRLVFLNELYDVVTVSQALHWLDDVAVCRGICRVLRTDGSFFVIHGTMEVGDAHPLASVLGHQSVLGAKVKQSFAAEVQPLLHRLTLLFDALDAPDVQRIDLAQQWAAPGVGATPRIVPAGVSLFRQRRPFGVGFARAFLTNRHIELAGLTPEAFWQDIEARCATATPETLAGTQNWAVLHFRRGGTPMESRPLEQCDVVEIGYQAGGR
jgi:ubiquinone/menaquinone biosynthesis C-methylase UbiE